MPLHPTDRPTSGQRPPKICEHCGKPFPGHGNRPMRFCSRQCAGQARALVSAKKNYICSFCNKEFRRYGDVPGVFCSLKCKGDWQRTQKPVDRDWLYQKYVIEGLSAPDIAVIVHRDSKRVWEWLRDYGIATRPRGLNLATTDDCYMKRSGVVNPFAGLHHSDETRSILSAKASCPKPYLRGKANGMYGKTGPLSPFYKGGTTPARQRLYSRPEVKKFLLSIYSRDGFRCVRCGSSGRGKKRGIHAHHLRSWVAYPLLRFDPDNVVTLCSDCHDWVHSRENVDRDYILPRVSPDPVGSPGPLFDSDEEVR